MRLVACLAIDASCHPERKRRISALRAPLRNEFDNMALDEMFEVFGITRSLSKTGCPYDNAVVESQKRASKPSRDSSRRKVFGGWGR